MEGVDYNPDDLYSDSSSSSSSEGDSDAGGSAAAINGHDPADSDGSSEQQREQQPWPQRFPALQAALSTAIQQLGGLVAPRLNWSSPTDALWLSSDNSLRCRNADEVSVQRVWCLRAAQALGGRGSARDIK